MDNTASNSVKFVGEVVPKTDVPSLSLPMQRSLSATDLSGLISMPQEVTRTINNADSRRTARTKQSRSPLPMPRSRLSVSVSKQRRSPSPEMARSQELRSRYAQLKQMQMVKYAKLHMDVNSPEDPVTCEEAGAAVNLLQQALKDQTKKTEQLAQTVATVHARADTIENIAAHNAGEIAQTNADLALLVRDLCVEM